MLDWRPAMPVSSPSANPRESGGCFRADQRHQAVIRRCLRWHSCSAHLLRLCRPPNSGRDRAPICRWKNSRASTTFLNEQIGDRQNSRRHRPDPAARQAGLFQDASASATSTPVSTMTTDTIFPIAFGDKNHHQRGGDDAGRPRQDRARRSRQQIHPFLCQHEGRRRAKGRDRPPRARPGAAAPPDHDRGSAAAHLRDHLRLLWRGAGEGRL